MKFLEGATVGIDLGTTYSAIAHLGADGNPNVVNNAVGAADLEATRAGLIDLLSSVTNTTTGAGIIDKTRSFTDNAATAFDESTSSFSLATVDISLLENNDDDLARLDTYVLGADAALADLIDVAAELGSVASRIDMQTAFISSQMDAVERGISQLVDADMNKQSVRLQALQTKQQLGLQALSIANSDSRNILTLFQSIN